MSSSSEDLKIIDFSFARKYNPTRRLYMKHGTPEFVSPEVVCEEPVTPAADIWSVGVIAYVLTSGISPFARDNIRDTLLAVRTGAWKFDEDAFSQISNDAKDFISKLMIKDPRKRPTATEALEHPFLQLAHHRGLGDRIPLDRHKGYTFKRKVERGIHLVRTIVKPVQLSSHLIEQPPPEMEFEVPVLQLPGDDIMSPVGPLSPPIPSLGIDSSLEVGAAGMLSIMGPPSMVSAAPSTVGSGGSSEWGREYEDEDTWYEFAYQSGADTHLMPSKDTRLGVRMAKYRRTTGKDDKPEATKQSAFRPRARPSMKERQDLRDLEKEREMEQDAEPSQSHLSHTRRGLWQVRRMMDLDKSTEGSTDRSDPTEHGFKKSSALHVSRLDNNDTIPCCVCHNSKDNILSVGTMCSVCLLTPLFCEKSDILNKHDFEPVSKYKHFNPHNMDHLWEGWAQQDTDAAMTCSFSYSEDTFCRDLDAPPPDTDLSENSLCIPMEYLRPSPIELGRSNSSERMLERMDTLDSMESSYDSLDTPVNQATFSRLEFKDNTESNSFDTLVGSPRMTKQQGFELSLSDNEGKSFNELEHSPTSDFATETVAVTEDGQKITTIQDHVTNSEQCKDDVMTISFPKEAEEISVPETTKISQKLEVCPLKLKCPETAVSSVLETPPLTNSPVLTFQETGSMPKLANLTSLLMKQNKKASTVQKADLNANSVVMPIQKRTHADIVNREYSRLGHVKRRITFSKKLASEATTQSVESAKENGDILEHLLFVSDEEERAMQKLARYKNMSFSVYQKYYGVGIVIGSLLAIIVRLCLKLVF